MGNEQSGPDGVGSGDAGGAAATPNAPSTPRPILRNSAGNFQAEEIRNRRNVVFRDQTEDALRFNSSIANGGGVMGGDGLVRLSQRVNDINGGGPRRQHPVSPVTADPPEDSPARRIVRSQKPLAPTPPEGQPESQGSEPSENQQPTKAPKDSQASRMREHVFALSEKKEKKSKPSLEPGGGRLFDPSVQELPTVTEEKEERDAARKDSGLSKADSKEVLREEIKQEILNELLSHSGPAVSAHTAATAAPEPRILGKMSDSEKRHLINEIRQQLLGSTQKPLPAAGDFTDDGVTPEPDYSEDELSSTPVRLPRFASQMEIRSSEGAANGHYRGPQLQQRRNKGPAPAPPNARYRRGGGPPIVRDPYQAQWEEPIYAYDGPQTPEQQQRQQLHQQQHQEHQEQQEQQEQMEKAYDDRYRQKSRSKRFGDSWKRMTASLSKAFGFNGAGGGGGGGGGGKGVSRRSSVRDSTFQRPADLAQQQMPSFNGSRSGSVYSLASAEMPPLQQSEIAGHRRVIAHARPQQYPLRAPDIWRDVALASHDQMELHASNPVFGAEVPPQQPQPEPDEAAAAHAANGSNGVGHAAGVSGSSSSGSNRGKSPVARISVPARPPVNAFREQTYL